jgi:alcohol dehydrogenase (cytochrome c)
MSRLTSLFRNKHLLTGAGSLALVMGAYALAQAQSTAPTGTGPFTQAQVDAGRAAYQRECSDCHGANLGGGPNGPGLFGPGFMARWGGQTTADYYKFMSATMPYGNEGRLSADDYASIASFIYAANGARPGTQTYTAATAAPFAGMVNGNPVAAVISPPGLVAQAGRGGRGPTGENGEALPAAGRGGAAAAPASIFGHTVEGNIQNYVDVTDAMLRNPSPNDWLMFRRNYQGWSYSPLTQITPANVKNLQLKWTWNMNEGGANQPTPLVHNGIMFLANSQNVIQALDARTGNLIWENRIGPDTRAYYGNRSIGLWKDKVYTATSDAHLVALDARTGRQVWKVQIGPPPKGETGGVIVINGKVLVGLMGCDNYSTEHCYISAFDAETGQRDWKFFTTALSGTPGGDTWNNLPDNYRGGVDTWIAGTYDPELNTTYWGTAQAKPWFRASRQTFGGHALYSSSTLALNPDDGKLKWYFQHIPGETLDLDEVFERVLINHGNSKEVFTIGKSGILWKLNRETGKFISLLPTIFQNIYSKIDAKTGELTYRDEIVNQKTNQWFGSCPGPEGGHNWQATSYNQPTDLLIIPLSQSCVMITGRDVELRLGGGGTANSQTFFFTPGSKRQMGRLSAVNTSTMKVAWTFEQRAPFLSAALSTRGGVAFVGDFDRVFQAVDVKTGKRLWSTRLGNTAQGYPITFAINGKQYIAITTGLGGGSPQQKPTLLLQNYVKRAATGHQIYVFGLPD